MRVLLKTLLVAVGFLLANITFAAALKLSTVKDGQPVANAAVTLNGASAGFSDSRGNFWQDNLDGGR